MGSAHAPPCCSCCGALSACKAWDASQSCATLGGYGKTEDQGVQGNLFQRQPSLEAEGRDVFTPHREPARSERLRQKNPLFCQHDGDWEDQEGPDVLTGVPHPHFHSLHLAFPRKPQSLELQSGPVQHLQSAGSSGSSLSVSTIISALAHYQLSQ